MIRQSANQSDNQSSHSNMYRMGSPIPDEMEPGMAVSCYPIIHIRTIDQSINANNINIEQISFSLSSNQMSPQSAHSLSKEQLVQHFASVILSIAPDSIKRHENGVLTIDTRSNDHSTHHFHQSSSSRESELSSALMECQAKLALAQKTQRVELTRSSYQIAELELKLETKEQNCAALTRKLNSLNHQQILASSTQSVPNDQLSTISRNQSNGSNIQPKTSSSIDQSLQSLQMQPALRPVISSPSPVLSPAASFLPLLIDTETSFIQPIVRADASQFAPPASRDHSIPPLSNLSVSKPIDSHDHDREQQSVSQSNNQSNNQLSTPSFKKPIEQPSTPATVDLEQVRQSLLYDSESECDDLASSKRLPPPSIKGKPPISQSNSQSNRLHAALQSASKLSAKKRRLSEPAEARSVLTKRRASPSIRISAMPDSSAEQPVNQSSNQQIDDSSHAASHDLSSAGSTMNQDKRSLTQSNQVLSQSLGPQAPPQTGESQQPAVVSPNQQHVASSSHGPLDVPPTLQPLHDDIESLATDAADQTVSTTSNGQSTNRPFTRHFQALLSAQDDMPSIVQLPNQEVTLNISRKGYSRELETDFRCGFVFILNGQTKQCEFVAVSANALRTHTASHKCVDVNRFRCLLCNISWSGSGYTTRHIRTCHYQLNKQLEDDDQDGCDTFCEEVECEDSSDSVLSEDDVLSGVEEVEEEEEEVEETREKRIMWTPDEDAQLLAAYTRHCRDGNVDWHMLANEFVHRKIGALKSRWTRLRKVQRA